MKSNNTALMERKAHQIKAHVEGSSPTLPPGVKRNKHQGIQRTVFIDKRNGWVFKVEKRYGEGCNQNEYNTYLRHKDKPEFTTGKEFRLPETMLISDVIVMEYVDGEHYNPAAWRWEEQSKLNTLLGLNDIHWQNVLLTKDGLTYVVDMGQ